MFDYHWVPRKVDLVPNRANLSKRMHKYLLLDSDNTNLCVSLVTNDFGRDKNPSVIVQAMGK